MRDKKKCSEEDKVETLNVPDLNFESYRDTWKSLGYRDRLLLSQISVKGCWKVRSWLQFGVNKKASVRREHRGKFTKSWRRNVLRLC